VPLFARLGSEEFLVCVSANLLLSQKIVKVFADGCPLSHKINILDKNFSTYPRLESLMKTVRMAWDLVCSF